MTHFLKCSVSTFAKQQERGCIEVAPLAYMRKDVLLTILSSLDEANTTTSKSKMFLTRLGFNSKDSHNGRYNADRPA